MKQTVNDVRAMWVVETGSDHHLVLMKVKLMKRAHTRVSIHHQIVKTYTRRANMKKNMYKKALGDSNTDATEKVVGRSKKRRIKNATSWWGDEVKKAVRKKKDMYKKAFGERSDRAWEDYKVAKKEAKCVVKEA